MSFYTHDEVEILGRAGTDGEMRYFQNGNPVTTFSLAVDRGYKDKNTGEWIKRTIWYRIQVFGKLAEICNERVHKGDFVFVKGQLQADWSNGSPRLWGDPPRASFELSASLVRFLSSRGDASDMVAAAQDLGGEVDEAFPDF